MVKMIQPGKIPVGAKVLLPLLAAALAVALVWGNRGVKVEKAKAAVKTVEDSVTEEGVITSGTELHVISEVAGPVAEILVAENERVKAGQVLYRIDPVNYTHRRESAEAELLSLKARKDRARISQVMTSSPTEYLDGLEKEMASRKAARQAAESAYQGYQALAAAGDISRLELERAEAEYREAESAYRQAEERLKESSGLMQKLGSEGMEGEELNRTFYDSEMDMLEAEVSGAESALELLREQEKKCEVKADRDGIVSSIPLMGQSAVAEGQETLVLRESGEYYVESDVLTSVAPWLSRGEAVEIVFNRKGKEERYPGTVEEIYDFASPGISALGLSEYRVRVKVLPDEPEQLEGKEGYGVTVRFPLYYGENVLTVPAEALFTEDGRQYVYRIEHGRAVIGEVESEYQSGGDAVITGGLSEGDVVVKNADAGGVFDGTRVR